MGSSQKGIQNGKGTAGQQKGNFTDKLCDGENNRQERK